MATDTKSAPAAAENYGYRQELERTIHRFASFAVAFSFISITTGIFTTYGLVLTTSGPVGIWTWPLVAVGQLLVAFVFASLASRIPLTGYSYQWLSRIAHPVAGWCVGWLSFTFLVVVACSVDYAIAQVVFPSLFGYTGTQTNEWLITAAILIAQAILVAIGTRVTARVNNVAVGTELVGIIGLTLLLLVVGAIKGDLHFGNLFTKGASAHAAGYAHFGLTHIGPLFFGFLLGAYTIVGFESAANLAEETDEPRRVVPRAMWTAVALAGVVGFVFLIAIAAATQDPVKLAQSATPVATVVQQVLGSVIGKLFLILVAISIFACGLVIVLTGVRLVWAMSRDNRFPGHSVLRKINPRYGTPLNAAALVLVVSEVILAVFAHNNSALVNLFSASTLLPALIYFVTVVVYVMRRRRLPKEEGFHLGRWDMPVVVGALIWLVFELSLFRDASFKDPRLYVLIMLGIGLLYLVYLLVTRGGPKGLEMPGRGNPDAELEAAAGVGQPASP